MARLCLCDACPEHGLRLPGLAHWRNAAACGNLVEKARRCRVRRLPGGGRRRPCGRTAGNDGAVTAPFRGEATSRSPYETRLDLLTANDRPGAYPDSWYAASAELLPPFPALEGRVSAPTSA